LKSALVEAQRHGHEIAEIRRKIRCRRPRRMPRSLIWALDLTYVATGDGQRPILGLIDHGTRACLALAALPGKGSVVLLRALLDVIERFGPPKVLRTDNEAVLTSRLFCFGLWLLGIRHQRIAPFAPWQNGRIEKFFGSFKEMWRLRVGTCAEPLRNERDAFRVWYNHVRPHQHLDGATPAEAWDGGARRCGKPRYFSEWDGLLTGFHFPP
jgi:putative transposase